ncbi:zinc finger MYM-type protein 1-like [Trichonephila clavipes]|uniref:Zinc finger MYM-type protein 1-like n=1 Tax=Trichonephila clavipes TaxID=2585209 RepID=A0A8X6RCC7_TRICX|nr:zinc finger MYM-type protein 1-like [Trichonephila clavipes]
MIECLGLNFEKHQIKQTGASPFFKILVNTLHYISKVYQLSIVVRYAEITRSENGLSVDIEVKTVFLGFYAAIKQRVTELVNQNAIMDMNDLKPTPKIARPLKETLAMFRKRAKTPTAPSAAARAAACIEEHRMKIKYMEMDEERKNEEHQLRMEQLSNNIKMNEERKNEEHKLRMELLRIKIAHVQWRKSKRRKF